jgi:hypothetical protein
MANRAPTAPTIDNPLNTIISSLDIFAFTNPMMMNVKHNRNNITKLKAISESMCYFLVLNGKTVASFGGESSKHCSDARRPPTT